MNTLHDDKIINQSFDHSFGNDLASSKWICLKFTTHFCYMSSYNFMEAIL